MIHRSPTPVVRPVELDALPIDVARGLAHLPGLVFLDSSSAESIGHPVSETGNLSILAAQPEQIIEGNIHQPGCRELLEKAIEFHQVDGLDLGFPTGGLIGWIEYNGNFRFGSYPEMLVYDYGKQQWFEVGGTLLSSVDAMRFDSDTTSDLILDFDDSMTREQFVKIVNRAQDFIAAGDIYQVNLSHRLAADWGAKEGEILELYQRLREVSPAPYSAFLDLGDRSVLSASPEQFLRISDRMIETRPIKGTRPRYSDVERDEKSAYDLITSPKEISELIMITDLERNDLGQISEFGTVETTELLKLERFAQVFHLVSTVQGHLRSGISPVEALAACFPGGSITGAPKKRAREIIAELESIPRGLYTGSIGCFGFNGESRFNIAIRTAIYENRTFHFHVGAGIVADSDPEMEWEETLHKAAGILRATSS